MHLQILVTYFRAFILINNFESMFFFTRIFNISKSHTKASIHNDFIRLNNHIITPPPQNVTDLKSSNSQVTGTA